LVNGHAKDPHGHWFFSAVEVKRVCQNARRGRGLSCTARFRTAQKQSSTALTSCLLWHSSFTHPCLTSRTRASDFAARPSVATRDGGPARWNEHRAGQKRWNNRTARNGPGPFPGDKIASPSATASLFALHGAENPPIYGGFMA
jgi:hypothetical protein